MSKMNFKHQLIFVLILIIIGNSLAMLFHIGIFRNIAWCFSGVLWILNPVTPEGYKTKTRIKQKKGIRIVGVIMVCYSLLVAFYP